MRILIVHNTLNDSKSVSGVLRHYAWMANEWTAAGHPTDFLVAKAAFPQLTDLSPGARLISSDNLFNATKYLAQTWKYFPAYAWRMATAHLTRFPERYDLVYASTQLIWDVYASRVIAARHGARLAAKVHHVLASQPERGGLFDRLFLWSERRTMRWFHQSADLVICGTEIVAQDFHNLEKKLGLPRKETMQVGYGIDLSVMGTHQKEPKLYDAVVLGRLHEHKGVFDLPEIWQQVVAQRPTAKLLVIGEGPHRELVESKFRERSLWENVRFTGGVTEAEKNKLLAQSRIGITPSFEEGWGLSVNEFLAAGLPVTGYALPVFAHVFPGQIDLVPLREKDQLAKKIVALLADETAQRVRGEQGRAFVKRYDYRNVAKAELAALQSIFTGPGRSTG